MLCRSDSASLALRDPTSEAMVLRYWDGQPRPESEALRMEPGQGIGGQVLATGRPFRTESYAEDPRISSDFRQIASRRGVVAILAVPIWIGAGIEMTLRPRLKIGEHLGGSVAASRQPLIVDDVSHDDRISPENLAFRRRYGLLAYLGKPPRPGTMPGSISNRRTVKKRSARCWRSIRPSGRGASYPPC